MTLPPLSGPRWNKTIHSLHQVTHVIAAIRIAVTEPLPNFLHLNTAIYPNGLSTGPLTVGEVRADFTTAEVIYIPPPPTVGPVTIGLAGETQSTLKAKLLTAIAGQGYTLELAEDADNHGNTLENTTPLNIDLALATAYAEALYRIFTATSRFRARLFAPMTPVVVWPGHFDLSTLIFTTESSEEHTAPHFNFGFAPFSDDIERPYFYVYGWPLPESGYSGITLPQIVQLDTPGYAGPLIWYDDIAHLDNPEGVIESTFMAIYTAVRPLVGT